MTKDSCSPQIEGGYIRIADELWDAICRTRILGEPRQVFDFIIRKTYGFGKRDDAISLSQFCLGTGLRQPNICHTISRLEAVKLIAVIKAIGQETWCARLDCGSPAKTVS